MTASACMLVLHLKTFLNIRNGFSNVSVFIFCFSLYFLLQFSLSVSVFIFCFSFYFLFQFLLSISVFTFRFSFYFPFQFLLSVSVFIFCFSFYFPFQFLAWQLVSLSFCIGLFLFKYALLFYLVFRYFFYLIDLYIDT